MLAVVRSRFPRSGDSRRERPRTGRRVGDRHRVDVRHAPPAEFERRQQRLELFLPLGVAAIAFSFIGWQGGEKPTGFIRLAPITGFNRDDYFYARFPAFPVITIGALVAVMAAFEFWQDSVKKS